MTPPIPTLDFVAGQSDAEGDVISLTLTGNAVTFAALNLPRGLSIDANTGVISGTIGYDAAEFHEGQYATTVFASNSQGGSTSRSFVWSVSNTVRDPVLTNPGNQTNARGSEVMLQLEVSQPDNELLTYEATGLPDGLSVHASGIIEGTIAHDAGSNTPYSVTVTVHAEDKSDSQTFTWTVPTGNNTPTLDDPGEQFGHAGEEVRLPLWSIDQDGDPLTFTATGLPAGLSLGQDSGVIEGTIDDSAAGNTPHSVTATVSDGTASASKTFLWNVSPLRLDGIDDQESVAGDTVSLQVPAHSATGATLTYSATGLPDGTSINSNSGLISGTIDFSAASNTPHTVTVSVTDGTRTEIQKFEWTVARLALALPDLQSNLAGDSVGLPMSVTYYGSSPLEWSADGLPAGLTIDTNTGDIDGILAANAAKPAAHDVTVSVSDGVETVKQLFFWYVGRDPNEAPVLTNPGSQTSQVGTPVTLQLSASDPEGDDILYDVVGLPEGLEIDPETGEITGTPTAVFSTAMVTVTTSDGFGASNSDSFEWTVAPAWSLSGGLRQGLVVEQSGPVLVGVLTTTPNADPESFLATIDPGDNSGPAGSTITTLGPGLLGVYLSDFAYTGIGSYTATVTVTGPGTPSVLTVTSTVEVGELYSGRLSDLLVGWYSGEDPEEDPGVLTATVAWGDGTSSAGEVEIGPDGYREITGEHTYATDSSDESSGMYPVVVTVFRDGQSIANLSDGVLVVRPPQVSLSGAAVLKDTAEDVEDFSGTVPEQTLAVFTVPSATATQQEHAATIYWGDGASSAVTIVGSNGLFRVEGGHTYAEAGIYIARVIIGQVWGALGGQPDPASFVSVAVGPKGNEVFLKDPDEIEKEMLKYAKAKNFLVTPADKPIIKEIAKEVVDSRIIFGYSDRTVMAADVWQRLNIVRSAYAIDLNPPKFINRANRAKGIFIEFKDATKWESVTREQGNESRTAIFTNTHPPAQAILELFNGGGKVSMDCAAFTNLLRIRGYLGVTSTTKRLSLGKDEGLLLFASRVANKTATKIMPYFTDQVREARDPIPGDMVLFDNPNVGQENPWRNENTIYLGRVNNKRMYIGLGLTEIPETANIFSEDQVIEKIRRLSNVGANARIDIESPTYTQIIADDLK